MLIENKKGQEKDISFVTIRSAVAKKFFPEIIKGTSVKEKSFREKMLAKLDKAIEEFKDKESVYSYVDGCCCELEMYEMADPDFR